MVVLNRFSMYLIVYTSIVRHHGNVASPAKLIFAGQRFETHRRLIANNLISQ